VPGRKDETWHTKNPRAEPRPDGAGLGPIERLTFGYQQRYYPIDQFLTTLFPEPRTIELLTVRPTLDAWLAYAADRTFVHQEGKTRHYDTALEAWTRHRVAAPVPHYVYMLRLATGSLYVGITRADRLEKRMKEHRRAADPDRWPASPGAYYVRLHRWGSIAHLALVPDRIAAWLTEVEWTRAIAARGAEVFGQHPSRDARVEWGANWLNPWTPTLCVDAEGRVTTKLVGI
jgi:predicted GIY-YIG superfamily endonuclease